MNKVREVKQIITGIAASDGDGVRLTRMIGSSQLNQLDPFLLFDAFGSDKPQDYIGGFPSHPHRGFEAVTYMMAGKMRHQDSVGNSGVIEAGGVQWMTAGKGIIHSEMPEQEQGLLAGFQLWVNLPAAHKMTPPQYQEKPSAEIPIEAFDGGRMVVIAGNTQTGTEGVVDNNYVSPIYWDVELQHQKIFFEIIPFNHNAFVYVIEGEIQLGLSRAVVAKNQLAVLTEGNEIQLVAEKNSRFLLIAGMPLNEPVERAGPFVMNTKQEIRQAFFDYQTGQLA